MLDILKDIYKDPKLVFLAVLLFGLAIFGIVPIPPGYPLDTPQRILFALLGISLIIIELINLSRNKPLAHTSAPKPPSNAEYDQKFREAELKTAREIVDKSEILVTHTFPNEGQLAVIRGNILDATGVDILVSSDDNWLQARGNVAKAILNKAGTDVEIEMNFHRTYRRKLRQGELAITTGGQTGAKFLFHPATIDLDRNRYPDKNLIRKIVKRSLVCASMLGAESIVFPVLGGGTGAAGSSDFKPWDSIQEIISESSNYLKQSQNDDRLRYVALYIYSKDDIKGSLTDLIQ